MNISEMVETGDVTVVSLESIRHAVDTGQRPDGYLEDYQHAALKVDEKHELLWITREEQDRLIRKYRNTKAPDITSASRDASKIRAGFVQQRIIDTPAERRGDVLVEMVRHKRLTANEAIEIKRDMDI